jgi:hypothetical protein
MFEARNSSRNATRRYAKVKSYYDSAIKFQMRKKTPTLKSSASLPSNKEYHRNYSKKYRRSKGA